MTSGDSEIPRDSDTHNQRVSNGGGLAWGRTLVYLLVTVLAAIVIVLSFYLPSLSNDESDTGITRLSQPSQTFIPEHATSQYADTGEGPQDVASYCPAVRESTDPYFGTQQRASLLARLNDPSTQTHSGHISVSSELARDHLRFGEAEEAIFILTQALEVEGRDDPDGKHRPELLKALSRIHRRTGMDDVRTAEGGEGVTGVMIRARIWVDGRLAGGLQALLGAPMAAYSGCGEPDGGIGHGKRRSRTGLARVCGDVGLAGGSVADGLRQAGSGMARSRARARLNCSSQGQRRGRCRVNRRAERVIRPAKAKTRRLRVLVVTIC